MMIKGNVRDGEWGVVVRDDLVGNNVGVVVGVKSEKIEGGDGFVVNEFCVWGVWCGEERIGMRKGDLGEIEVSGEDGGVREGWWGVISENGVVFECDGFSVRL